MAKLALVPLLLLSFAAVAVAQIAFDGTWKIELSTPPASNPDVWLADTC